MLEELKKLLSIQEKDLEILKIEDQKIALPKLLDQLKKVLDDKSKELGSTKSKLKELQVEHKKLDVELESKHITRLKYETQLMGVKTNQEYKSFEKEIFTLKTDISRFEDEVLEKMMGIDSQNAIIKKKEAELEDVKNKYSQKELEIKNKIQEFDSRLQTLKGEREILVKDVEPVFYKRYTRILNHVHGRAIVPMVDRSCQGCHTLLTPQVLVDIRREVDLISCDNCARVLYISEESKTLMEPL